MHCELSIANWKTAIHAVTVDRDTGNNSAIGWLNDSLVLTNCLPKIRTYVRLNSIGQAKLSRELVRWDFVAEAIVARTVEFAIEIIRRNPWENLNSVQDCRSQTHAAWLAKRAPTTDAALIGRSRSVLGCVLVALKLAPGTWQPCLERFPFRVIKWEGKSTIAVIEHHNRPIRIATFARLSQECVGGQPSLLLESRTKLSH